MCSLSVATTAGRDSHLTKHFEKYLVADLPSQAPFACPLCRYVARDKRSLVKHYGTYHGVVKQYFRDYLASRHGEEQVKTLIPEGTYMIETTLKSKLGVQIRYRWNRFVKPVLGQKLSGLWQPS